MYKTVKYTVLGERCDIEETGAITEKRNEK